MQSLSRALERAAATGCRWPSAESVGYHTHTPHSHAHLAHTNTHTHTHTHTHTSRLCAVSTCPSRSAACESCTHALTRTHTHTHTHTHTLRMVVVVMVTVILTHTRPLGDAPVCNTSRHSCFCGVSVLIKTCSVGCGCQAGSSFLDPFVPIPSAEKYATVVEKSGQLLTEPKIHTAGDLVL